jgi:tetratricopeptide (TPR) repeat protein
VFTTSQRQTAAGIVLIAALMAAAIAVQRLRDASYTLPEPPQQALYLTSDRAVGRLALGFQALNADLYWIRALQYYGGIQRAHREGRRSPEPGPEYGSLYQFLDLATSLDPQFNIAYRFGSIFLSEPAPAGPGRPDLAIRLLNKGLAARPDKWEYMQDIGFVHYWWDHDYHAAAAAFQKASEIPNAPWWLRSLAATTLAQGGDRRSSRMMWTVLAQSAEIDWLRNSAVRNLQQLDALDAIDALQRLVDAYRDRAGSPLTWQTLARAGAPLRAVPTDPAGTPYDLTPDGRVRLGAGSKLFPLPQEPPRAVPAS